MPYGYTGKTLRVNLTDGTISVEEHDERFYRRYFGGRNFIAYTLLKELEPGVDPLGPENKLIFATGVITGTPVAGAGRHSVGAKSPLTGGYGEAEVGGYWGSELKRAGFDAIIVEGQAAEPVYLWVHDGEAEIRPANHLWGKHVGEAEDAIRDELQEPRLHTALIGQAGENRVRMANIIHDRSRSA
ncbi:MAG TPA: aldehyde ferredoxin oxidoreductase, partial [Anaerolineae bacterium]|nr:aldehyde ferredoxin oxidoreductase [Anaerolineae bacterium]